MIYTPNHITYFSFNPSVASIFVGFIKTNKKHFIEAMITKCYIIWILFLSITIEGEDVSIALRLIY